MDKQISSRPHVRASGLAAVAATLIVATALLLRPSAAPHGGTPSSSAALTSSGATSDAGASAAPSLPPGVVAWIDATPAPSASRSEPPTSGLPVCSSDALDIRFAGWGGLSGGALYGRIVMSEPDANAPTCVLSGAPTVSVLDAHGRTMAIDIGPLPDASPAAVIIEPGLPLPPEHDPLLVGQAGFSVLWSNWCGRDPGSSGTIVVGLPGWGTRRMPVDLKTPTCLSAADRSVIGVVPIEAAEAPQPSSQPQGDLVGHIEVPSVVVAGETLRYYVTLRNIGDQPAPLDPCPAYVELLGTNNAVVAEPHFLLNCAAASAIEPGASLTFEMVLQIPGDAPAGPAILFWVSDGLGAASQKQPITIAPPGSAVGSVAPATLPPSRDELDLADAKRVATSYETARAGGEWQAAWQLLSSFSQKKIGSIDAFIRDQTAYNTAGGSTFVVTGPTRNGGLISPAFLGTDLFFDLKGNADIERALFVGVIHPDARGASAGSEDLVAARLRESGDWRVWVR